ncbi:1,4-beta-xylanase [Niabella ginsenosidivorans]|uniref:1,4-beta-xylanase n=1 Tax=Niabella ginsenosidivorans TaxID=1176587 RepID=A0A1A9I625_9BACT|nr:alpha/beta hydrolase [Niabella ginsenosidivorans]ANH82112.1 1,4-beta-xylanase [Niabella ginsenosidivorans]
MTRLFCLSASLFFFSMIHAQTEIALYKNVPNSQPAVNVEKAEKGTDGITRISNVSVPTIMVFQPSAKSKKPGPAVVICPGGGYAILAFDHEGTQVAQTLNEWGMTAFVLKYRLPDDRAMVDKSIAPLQDAERAMQWVREHAKEYNVDIHRVGIMGFSAGGHLAATLSTHYNDPLINNPRKISFRPDFSVLVYPVISFSDSIGHTGSRNNLIGKSPSQKMIERFSNELHVNKNTPPAFLVHAKDDKTVPWRNSEDYYEALLKNGVPAKVYYYEAGGHGFGLHNKTSDVLWAGLLKEWLQQQHIL